LKANMQYRDLGRTGLRVSLAGLGTGGDSRLGQSTHKDASESHRVVRRALDLGINLIDTAPVYMESERLLGEALAGVPRDSYILATKVTPRHEGALASPERINASLEESLRRLQTDYVDLFLFHGVTRAEYPGIRDQLRPVAEQLRSQGKVRFIGVTEPMPGAPLTDGASEDAGHEMVVQAAQDGVWDAVMLKYGALDQSAERTALPAAAAAGLGVLNMSPVRGAMVNRDQLRELLAEWKRLELVDPSALPDGDSLEFLVHDGTPSVSAAGYRFVAENPAISTVLVGTGNAEHLEDSVAAILSGPLPSADSARLRQLFDGVVLARE
jgi:L-galactose dehydrogenase